MLNQINFQGCNRGFVSRHVLAETVKHLYLCDMSPTMLQQAEGTPGLNITKKEMDEELQFDVIEIEKSFSKNKKNYNLAVHTVRARLFGFGDIEFESPLG